MGKVAFYLYDSMVDFETSLLSHFMKSFSDKEVIYFSKDNSEVKASSGVILKSEKSIEEVLEFDDIEALIFPGGLERKKYPELTKLINKVYENKGLIAAICAGPEFLTETNILDKHKYTTTMKKEEYDKKEMEDPFNREKFSLDLLVRDENVITAVGRSFIDFTFEVIDYFKMFKTEEDKNTFKKLYKGEKI
ncbi:MAG: DJ-1/PfpI family protein [Thermotogota bacterium]